MKLEMPVFILAVLTLSIASCHPSSKYYDYRLTLENKTAKTIMGYYTYSYPDTSLPSALPQTIFANSQIAGPGGELKFARGGTWEIAFRDDIPSGKIMIFVLDKQVVDSQPWDSIKHQYMILKRYDLTIDSLKAHDFKLTIE